MSYPRIDFFPADHRRHPKFRVFQDGKMFYLEANDDEYNHYLQIGSEGFWVYDSDGSLVASAKKGGILMEFTGLKDAKSSEIYEGDILMDQYNDDEMDESNGERTKIVHKIYYPVIFKDGAFGWIGEQTGEFYSFADEPIPECPVVGNIHQNAELLKANFILE